MQLGAAFTGGSNPGNMRMSVFFHLFLMSDLVFFFLMEPLDVYAGARLQFHIQHVSMPKTLTFSTNNMYPGIDFSIFYIFWVPNN